ncbi:hypothetical protein A9267_17610 [Shewanella sp. UCD-FRSSP16_17]|uniref:hypothetical protein n=1 Tax=Shewanella sp. UCD-FRSSP16_17 TaxID=1853256 RepID=UPI0007EECAE5|nr:hypothetical protein [Shewanella sp. UCD-FRSSP16_17]OBT04759.1 hypothetical protein A9267_17610 [Shewanella sp. UCD-FRSSP16_17]
MKSILIPIFVFGLMKILLTLVVTFESISNPVRVLLFLLILIKICFIHWLATGRWFFGGYFSNSVGEKKE